MKRNNTEVLSHIVSRRGRSKVGQYLSATIAQRMDATRKAAEDNHILIQAEDEAKDYIEMLLKAIGRADVMVTFAEKASVKAVAKK